MMPNDLNAIAGLDCVIAVVKIESMTFPRLDQFNILKFAIVISGDEQNFATLAQALNQREKFAGRRATVREIAQNN